MESYFRRKVIHSDNYIGKKEREPVLSPYKWKQDQPFPTGERVIALQANKHTTASTGN